MPEAKPFCPYVGLQPYTEEQRDYFFGRERDIRVIASNLYASPLTVLYGASGVGKSSVLLAGVVPHLHAGARTAVVVFRDWQQPAAHQLLKVRCLEAVAAAHKRPLDIPVTLPLDELLLKAAAVFGGTTLIILDQFEEYFLYNQASDAEDSFDAELARTINREEVDANFLIALREDGLAKLDRFRPRIPHLLGNLLRLRHLDPHAAEEAIRGPLRVWQSRFPNAPGPGDVEDELVRAVLAQVQRGQIVLNRAGGVGQAEPEKTTPQIETPFLQLVMTRLWEEELAQQSRVLRYKTMESLGGAAKIARTYLDGIMDQLDSNRREVCSRFFDRLVTPSGSKIAYTLEDLTKYAGDLALEVTPVLKSLTENRILRGVVPAPEQPGAPRYEIFHDVLGAAVLDWRRRFLTDKAKAEAEKQAQEKLEAQRRENEQARQLSEERARTAEERLRSARKLRRLTNVAAATFVIAVLACGWAWTNFVKRRHAEQDQALERSGRQEAEQSLELEHNKEAEASAAAKAANQAAQDAKADNELAQKANQKLVAELQAQLDDARKLIQSSTNQAGTNAALALAYLETVKKTQAELDKTRAEAKVLAAKADKATKQAEQARLEAEKVKSVLDQARGGVLQNNKWQTILQTQQRSPTASKK